MKSRIRKDSSFSFTYKDELPIPFLIYTPLALHYGEIIIKVKMLFTLINLYKQFCQGSKHLILWHSH